MNNSRGAVLSHSFELEAKTKTVYYGAPAVITFRIPTKAALQVWHFPSSYIYLLSRCTIFRLVNFQEAFSTPIMPLDVLADRPPVKKFDWVSFSVITHTALLDVDPGICPMTSSLFVLYLHVTLSRRNLK